ncbi:MAG TPA: ATP-binding cassette domain-containing protein [Thermoanaerobaculia bacterium]|nr:ATP-binding cassette domain-containing protein [Thermoanaerobaculia bacterium]
MTDERSSSPLLEMRNISKSFPGVRALDHVSLELHSGEIHALVGENGAGKSTLMNVLGGVFPHGSYDGEVLIDSELCQFSGVRTAEESGIAVVHQELSLIPEFSIAENIFLGREPRRFGVIQSEELFSRAKVVLSELHLNLEPHLPVGYLGIGQQHLVEIAKALAREARILVLDEPTAALTESEADVLFRILDTLRHRGTGIIYISHKLGEVFRLADRITVLRDGRAVSTDGTSSLDPESVIARMVGREVSDLFPDVDRRPADVIFEARDVSVEDPNVPDKLLVDHVNFTVRRGEVLGIAGLVGAGRSDLMMALFGAHAGPRTGEFFMGSERVTIGSPSEAIACGIGFVTEDRKRFGLFLDQTIVSNLTVAALARLSGAVVTDVDAEASVAGRSMRELHIKAQSAFTIAGTLSGGNQQKVVLAKWLLTSPKLLLLDEPTRGIDVGAKQEIYREIARLAGEGLSIVLVSSEMSEVLSLSDRVMVLHEGRVTGEFLRSEATAEAVMACATGSVRSAAAVAPGGLL